MHSGLVEHLREENSKLCSLVHSLPALQEQGDHALVVSGLPVDKVFISVCTLHKHLLASPIEELCHATSSTHNQRSAKHLTIQQLRLVSP